MTRALFVTLLLVACDGEGQRDAERVLAAVQRFRSADLAATPGVVDALRQTPCHATDACATRDACVAAGEATSRALTLKNEVARKLDALEKGSLDRGSDEATTLPGKLDEAEALLKQGFDLLPACDERVTALKLRHRL